MVFQIKSGLIDTKTKHRFISRYKSRELYLVMTGESLNWTICSPCLYLKWFLSIQVRQRQNKSFGKFLGQDLLEYSVIEYRSFDATKIHF